MPLDVHAHASSSLVEEIIDHMKIQLRLASGGGEILLNIVEHASHVGKVCVGIDQHEYADPQLIQAYCLC